MVSPKWYASWLSSWESLGSRHRRAPPLAFVVGAIHPSPRSCLRTLEACRVVMPS